MATTKFIVATEKSRVPPPGDVEIASLFVLRVPSKMSSVAPSESSPLVELGADAPPDATDHDTNPLRLSQPSIFMFSKDCSVCALMVMCHILLWDYGMLTLDDVDKAPWSTMKKSDVPTQTQRNSIEKPVAAGILCVM